MISTTIIYFSLVILKTTNCHNWDATFPEISNIRPGQTIILHQNYTQLQIRGLHGTLFYNTLSQLHDVSKIKIFDTQIREIETGAICSAPSMKTFQLNFAGNSKAPRLTKNVFRRCKAQLKELFLNFDYDNPSKIEHNALEEASLEKFGLRCLKIKHLKKNFLKLKEKSLRVLVLSSCHLSTIDSDVFEGMNNLEELEISYNHNLRHLPQLLFMETSKIKKLGLRYNRLRELNWDEFQGFISLEYLDVSGNRLVYFNARVISTHMSKLQRMDIRKNPLPCKLKEIFANEAKMNFSIEVAYSVQPCPFL